MKLETAVRYMGAEFPGAEAAMLGRDVDTFRIDSREVGPGDVFFALSQPDYRNNCFNDDFADAHVFVPAAFEKGAAACVVRPDRFEQHEESLSRFKGRLIFATDCIAAMQSLARNIYKDWGRPVVGITGSAGKTTAKELAAHVLAHSGKKVLRNIKNYNNGLGLPLTVFNLLKDDSYDVAVLEMGMSTPNREIERLCSITPPDVAIELCVLPVHIEHLGTIENIQKAKAELVRGLKPGGTAILNAEDFRVAEMAGMHSGPNLTYGIESAADLMAKDVRFERFGETRFLLCAPDGEAEVVFPLNGRHNIMNALAASGAAHVFGMGVAEIAEALSTVTPPSQRGEVIRFKEGFTVINDTYNSNPDALVSMVATLVDGGAGSKRKVVVAGAMRELGENESQMHFETGQKIASLGIDKLYGVEGLAAKIIEGAESVGFKESRFYENSQVAAEEFVGEVREGDVILVKGSRGVRTEKVIEKLLEKFTRE